MEIPIISKQAIDEIDAYFQLTKPLSQDEMAKWRLIKKAVPILHEFNRDPSVVVKNDQVWAALVIGSVEERGVCNEIMAQLIIKSH